MQRRPRLDHNRWIFMDADDTVLGVEIDGQKYGTAYAYTHVLNLFQDAMELYGFDRDEVLTRQREIDMERAKVLGFGDKSRFPVSMGLTYTDLALKYDRPWKSHRKNIMEQIGWQVFTYPYVALDNAMDVLEVLYQEYNIAIVTKGELHEQRKKVDQSGVGIFADECIVLPHKSDGEWADVFTNLGLYDLRACWAIGNSVKSDVNPPLRFGANGIHLAVGSWAFEEAAAEDPWAYREFYTVADLRDVLKLVPFYSFANHPATAA